MELPQDALTESPRIAGRVLDPWGAPVEEATVCLYVAGSGLSGLSQRTGPIGSFAFAEPTPQAYVLCASKNGFQDTRPLRVKLKEGEQRGDLVLMLRKGLCLQGKVLDVDGRPVAGAQVGVDIVACRGQGLEIRGVLKLGNTAQLAVGWPKGLSARAGAARS